MRVSEDQVLPPVSIERAHRKGPFWWLGYVPVALAIVCAIALIIAVGGSILIPLLLSLAISFLLEPVANRLERKGLPRSQSALLTMLAAFVILIVLLVVLLPSVYHQLRESFEKLPLALRAGAARAQELLSFAKQRLSPDLFGRLQGYISDFEQDPSALTSRIGGWLSKGLLGLVSVGSAALGLIIVPFFIYYLLLDFKNLRRLVNSHIPVRYRPEGLKMLDEIGEVVRGYVQGRFLIACIMACIYGLGLLILRVPLWAGIGIIAGVIGIIPYLGVTSGLVLAVSFAALDGAGFARIAGVLVVFTIAQLTEDYVLTPRIIGGKLELHPMLVFIALIVAGDLFGLLGLVLAIPTLAVIKVIVKFFDTLYLRSRFYLAAEYYPAEPVQPVEIMNK